MCINYFTLIKVNNMNFDTEYSKPTLIEPGIKYFLNETLKQCRLFKEKYNNTLFNISILIIFILILGVTLIVKYKGKLTPSEKEQKENEKKTIYSFQNKKLSTR